MLKNNKKEIGKWLDAVIFGVLLGHAIGRIGCFLQGCCYGITTNIPWANRHPHPYKRGVLKIQAALVLYLPLLAF
jgi:phosphatidylglycerol:prolipoprotein diacylglycerol transferase